MITKQQVEKAKKGVYSIQERVDDAGFVYFPDGRVTWKINENPTDPDNFEVELFESWGSPGKLQIRDIMRLVAAYVSYNRQQKKVTA
jgi:hypothetical protein